MRYTLYGLTGTYTWTATLTESVALDKSWDFSFGPFSPDQGEPVEDRYIFKLAVEGLSDKDANWYRVALSSSPDANTVRSEARMFASSWTLLVDESNQPHLHPYVTGGMKTLWLRSFGCDIVGGRLLIWTSLQRKLETWCLANGTFAPADFSVEDGEDGATWAVDWSEYIVPMGETDYLVFWAEDEQGSALPVFTRRTIRTPP
jgi:hypothetical protein